MKRFIGIWIILLIQCNVYAQYSLDVGLVVSPSNTIIRYLDSNAKEFNNINPLNYGFKVQIQENRFKWSVGFIHLTLGHINYVMKTTTDFPEGTGEFEEWIYKARGIAIPIIGDYILKANSINRISIGLGISPVFFYSQKRHSPFNIKDNIIIISPELNNSEFRLLPKIYYLFNLGSSYEFNMNDRWLLGIRPCFLFQYSTVTHPVLSDRKIKTSSFGLDIGISYILSK